MDLITSFKEALVNLTSAKLRSILAVLGILVGTASVVAMVSGGQMATAKALAQFKLLGTDLMALNIYVANNDAVGSSQDSPSLSLSQVLSLSRVSQVIETIAPYTNIYLPLKINAKVLEGTVIGATATLAQVLKIKVATGRFITDLDGLAYYCVIGDKLAKQLRAAGVFNPLGQQLQLGTHYFTIVGVLAPWPENNFFNQDLNQSAIIPLQMSAYLSKYATISDVVMHLRPAADINDLQAKLTQHIHTSAPGLKLFFRSAKELIKSMQAQQQTLTLLLGLIGSISLIVGGIGVMNIMLVSVVERRREIGIRLAVGARSKDIQWLFLAEAMALAGIGGFLGVLLGIAIAAVVAVFADWTFEIFILPVALGFMVSVATGIFFGFYPAYKAARLDPIEALRAD